MHTGRMDTIESLMCPAYVSYVEIQRQSQPHLHIAGMWELRTEASYPFKRARAHHRTRLAHAVLGHSAAVLEPFASLPYAPGCSRGSCPSRLVVAMKLFYLPIYHAYFR